MDVKLQIILSLKEVNKFNHLFKKFEVIIKQFYPQIKEIQILINNALNSIEKYLILLILLFPFLVFHSFFNLFIDFKNHRLNLLYQ